MRCCIFWYGLRVRSVVIKRGFSELEYLETNSLGGYSSSSLLGATRKYHGLFIAGPLSDHRILYVSSLEEKLSIEGKPYYLNTLEYPQNIVFPKGYLALKKFSNVQVPTWSYQVPGWCIQKQLMMVPLEETVLLRYRVTPKKTRSREGSIKIFLKPLLACRQIHSVSKKNNNTSFEVKSRGDQSIFSPYPGILPLVVRTSKPLKRVRLSEWYYQQLYVKESERGFMETEDLFAPMAWKMEVSLATDIYISFSLKNSQVPLRVLWREVKRKRNVTRYTGKLEPGIKGLRERLKQSVSHFLVKKDQKMWIVAGYHWFLSWGRDSMISLPGLLLETGRSDMAINVLETYADYEKNGLIPNFIDTKTYDAAYNSVDASLWYAWAVQKWVSKMRQVAPLEEKVLPCLERIFWNYLEGTHHNIGVHEKGLLHAGHSSSHLTWMDAVVGGVPVTSRHGYAVEINALWYNFLCFLKTINHKFRAIDIALIDQQIALFRASFEEVFWIEKKGYYADVLNQNYQCVPESYQLRPNQCLALSLPFRAVTSKRAESALMHIKKSLWTPCGLRTLAPQDAAYNSQYQGGAQERDKAYHNGTVWAWWGGHYLEAMASYCSDKRDVAKDREEMIAWFSGHLEEEGLAMVSEIFDGDAPHRSRGCIHQAWSVAELLRGVLSEETL